VGFGREWGVPAQRKRFERRVSAIRNSPLGAHCSTVNESKSEREETVKRRGKQSMVPDGEDGEDEVCGTRDGAGQVLRRVPQEQSRRYCSQVKSMK
jgi:hypothetical protein